MNVARAKLDLIKPEEVNMDEYEVSRGVFWVFFVVFLAKIVMDVFVVAAVILNHDIIFSEMVSVP